MTSKATPGSESRVSAAGRPSVASPNSARKAGLPWTTTCPGPNRRATGCGADGLGSRPARLALGAATVRRHRDAEDEAHGDAHGQPGRNAPGRHPDRRADAGPDRDAELRSVAAPAAAGHSR